MVEQLKGDQVSAAAATVWGSYTQDLWNYHGD